MGKGRKQAILDSPVFVTEEGEAMTERAMVSMLRDYAAHLGLQRGIRLNTFAMSKARHMFEDGHSIRSVRQFFRDSTYPEAETGDYGDMRSVVTAKPK